MATLTLSEIGSVPLRMVAKTMRKQGKLAGHTKESIECVARAASCRGDTPLEGGHISGKQIAVLDSAAYISVINRAVAKGVADWDYVADIARWAQSKGSTEGSAETAPQANASASDKRESDACECGHPWEKHSAKGGAGCLAMFPPGSHTFCQCRLTMSDMPEVTAPEAPKGSEMEASEVEVESEEVDFADGIKRETVSLVNGEAFDAFKRGLEGMMRGVIPAAPAIDESKVREIVAKAIGETGALRVEIVRQDGTVKAVEGRTHKLFPTLVKMIAASDNPQRKLIAPFLVGPAGSGKTAACAQAAESLGLRFFSQSVCSQTTASVLMGYYDANGRYVRSLFREAYENGGLYLLDEIDAGNPNVLAVLNAALSNGHCAFPDGMIPRHADFRCCAAGNTYGSGRTVEYVGRNPIDAATGNRFVKLSWPYDEKLERDICPMPDWAIYVQKWRASLARRGVKHILSPRQSLDGALLLGAGLDVDTVIDIVLTAGMPEDTAKTVREEVGDFNV